LSDFSFLLDLPWGLSAPQGETYKQLLLVFTQVIGAAVVLVATGTLIIAQIAQSSTPRIFRTVPKKIIFRFFGFLIVVFSVDVASIIMVPAQPSRVTHTFMAAVIITNVAALASIFPYASAILSAVHPETLISSLVSYAKSAKAIEKRDYLLALKEIGLESVHRRQSHLSLRILEAYEQLSTCLLDQWVNAAKAEDKNGIHQVLEIVPQCLEHLMIECGNAGQEEPVKRTFEIVLQLMSHYEKRGFRHDEIREFSALLPSATEICARSGWPGLCSFISQQLLERIRLMVQDDLKVAPYLIVRTFPAVLENATDLGSDVTVTVCECFYHLARELRDFPGADGTITIVLKDKVEILDGQVWQGGLTTKTPFRSDLWETVHQCLSVLAGRDFKQTHWPFKDAGRLLAETNELLEQDLFQRGATAEASGSDAKSHRIPGSDIWMIASDEPDELEADPSYRTILFKDKNELETEEFQKNLPLKSEKCTSPRPNRNSRIFVFAGLVAILGLTLHFRRKS
jgi:hypothetical protein